MKIHRTFAPRRRFLGATLAVLSILALAGPANAQNWPDRPIKLLVPFAAGGNIDVTGRLMAARLSEALGQQMVVENRVGGGGIIAMEAVQRSAPDGYTLLWASTNVMAIVPATTKVKYDPVKDFAPISELGSSPQVLLVNSKVPAKTVAEFVAYAKAQPAASRLWRRRRTRQRQQPDHGAVPQSRRSQDDQRQLSRHRAGADRRDRRRHSRHVRADLGSGRAGHQSEHPHSGGVERQALGAPAGRAVDRGNLSGLQRGVLDRDAGARGNAEADHRQARRRDGARGQGPEVRRAASQHRHRSGRRGAGEIRRVHRRPKFRTGPRRSTSPASRCEQ